MLLELWCLVVVHGSLIALGKIVAAFISSRAMVRASDQRHLNRMIQALTPVERKPKQSLDALAEEAAKHQSQSPPPGWAEKLANEFGGTRP